MEITLGTRYYGKITKQTLANKLLLKRKRYGKTVAFLLIVFSWNGGAVVPTRDARRDATSHSKPVVVRLATFSPFMA